MQKKIKKKLHCIKMSHKTIIFLHKSPPSLSHLQRCCCFCCWQPAKNVHIPSLVWLCSTSEGEDRRTKQEYTKQEKIKITKKTNQKKNQSSFSFCFSRCDARCSSEHGGGLVTQRGRGTKGRRREKKCAHLCCWGSAYVRARTAWREADQRERESI